MKRAALLALVFSLVLGTAGAAAAYPLYSLGTEVRSKSFRWSYSGLGSDGKPYSNPAAPADEVRAAIAATFTAFDPAHTVDSAGRGCSTLAFVEGTPDGGDPARSDTTVGPGGRAVVNPDGDNTEGVFVSSANDPLYQFMQGGVVAFADPLTDDDNYVIDCDTVYNAVDQHFVTSGGQGIDLQGVAMQETAHCFGLHHVCRQSAGDGQPSCDGPDVDTKSVMFPFVQPGFGAHAPDARDLDNMCQIYPSNGVGRPCDPLSDVTGSGYKIPDCQAGFTCGCTDVGDICTRACASDAECPIASRCGLAKRCVPDFYPKTGGIGVPTRTSLSCDVAGAFHRAVGSPCAADADCGPDELCLTASPGGYCTVDCSRLTCPGDALCGADAAGEPRCLAPCTLDAVSCSSGCRPGYVCGSSGACVPPCKSNADCGGGNVDRCDTATGICFTLDVGRACGPKRGIACRPACAGQLCGEGDGCGGTCAKGSGCKLAAATAPAKACGCSSGGAQLGAAWALAALLAARRRRRK